MQRVVESRRSEQQSPQATIFLNTKTQSSANKIRSAFAFFWANFVCWQLFFFVFKKIVA